MYTVHKKTHLWTFYLKTCFFISPKMCKAILVHAGWIIHKLNTKSENFCFKSSSLGLKYLESLSLKTMFLWRELFLKIVSQNFIHYFTCCAFVPNKIFVPINMLLYTLLLNAPVAYFNRNCVEICGFFLRRISNFSTLLQVMLL